MSEDTPKLGRPRAEICWERVGELAEAGCKTVEIAAYFGVDPKTLYDRCPIDMGMSLSIFTQEKRAKGESLLREVQFKKAMGISDKGDNTLLIWLGKQRLEQKEKQEIEHTVIEKENEIIQE